MLMKHTRLVAACLVLWALPSIAEAYIGPGAGITFIGALIGLVAAVLSAIGFILFWPIRRALKRRKAKANPETEMEAAEAEDEPPPEEPPDREQ